MGRVAVVAGPDAGHAYPALGIAAALARRGHEVVFCSGAGHADLAAAHGCDFLELPLLAPTDRDDDFGHLLWRRGAAMAVPLAAALRGRGLDVVVVDLLTRGGAFAAHLLGLPWIESIPHHLPDPAPDLPPVGLGRGRPRHVLRRLDDRRINRQQRASVLAGHRQALEAARGIGLDGVSPPALRLVATLPSLERDRLRWPARAHVVGPLAVEPPLPPLDPPGGDEPLVVVTDSTATGAPGGLGEVALRALRHLDLRVVVTSGDLPPRRDGRIVVGRGPHRPLLEQATLAVGPGGGGFVSKVAAAGVPMVVVPQAGDQREAAVRLADAGVARMLRPRQLTPTRLRWAVVRHLADRRPVAAAARLAEEAAQLGPDLAAALVERVMAGARPFASGPAEHLRPHPGAAGDQQAPQH